jgi:predicted RNA-binding Zn ribbon-like protein
MAGTTSRIAPGELGLVEAFVNTSYGTVPGRGHQAATTPRQLHSWLVDHGLLAADAVVSEGDFRRAIALREGFRALLQAHTDKVVPPETTLEELNRLAGDAPLAIHFQAGGEVELVPDIGGIEGAFARLLSIVFQAMLTGSWSRLKACSYTLCTRAFYDASKNASGKWCAMAKCGNRLNARAYRHRQQTPPKQVSRNTARFQAACPTPSETMAGVAGRG